MKDGIMRFMSHIWLKLNNDENLLTADKLPIRLKKLYNQSINQSSDNEMCIAGK